MTRGAACRLGLMDKRKVPGVSAPVTVPIMPPGTSLLRVLVVEDDLVFSDFITELLAGTATEVHRSTTLSDALIRVLAGGIDCVVLDLGLPDASGLDAVESLRSLHRPPALVVLTGDADPNRAIAALALGAQDYVRKRDLQREHLDRSVRYAIERHRLEERLREASQMEAVGRLAGRVAHDLNNMLMAIFGHSELARSDLGGLGGEAQAILSGHLDAIESASARTAELTRELLAYSNVRGRTVGVISVRAVVEELLVVLASVVGSCSVALSATERNDFVRIGRSQFEAIVTNLIVNARDAMPEGGEIRLDVRVDDALTRKVVQLRVADEGTGMSAATLDRLFESHFTTKPDGSGLGLAAVKSFVEIAGGTVGVASVLGAGTEFTIELPWQPTPSLPEPPRHVADVHQRRILVIDDDAQVRHFVTRVLLDVGYQVDELSGTTAAADTLKIQHHDLMISDIVMPDGDGRRLAQQIRDQWPELPIILMSAFASVDGAERGLDEIFEDSAVTFLSKPFGGEELRRAVHAALERSTSATGGSAGSTLS